MMRYNANPSSMSESISTGSLEGKRKIAMLGDMLEPGDFWMEEGHRQLADYYEEGYSGVVFTF